MKIQIKVRGKTYYIQAKERRKQPDITPYKARAWHFQDLNDCKPVRDDVLEYFPDATIVS